MSEQYFADDRIIIPEYIRKMTSEERKAEITRIEQEDREKREHLKQERKLAAVQ